LDQKARIEQYLSRKAEDMFAAVLGPGRANVQVDVAIDTSSRTQDKISPDAITKGVTHEVSKTSSVTSGTKGEGAAAPTNKEETTETNTNPGQVTEHLVDMPGTIKSKTVAAFVDLAGEKSADGKTAPTSITLKDAEDILRGAIGVGPTDTLKIVNTPFHHSEQEAQAAKADEGGFFNKDFILEIARRSSLGILVIGVLVMLKIFGGSKSKGGSAKVLAGATAGAQGALPAGAGDGDVDAEALRGRITAALQENPEEVKKLFLSWVESDRSEA
jgi:flagellar biosynthesis/type III secretory pathway M-ring protein FliF/YscJ